MLDAPTSRRSFVKGTLARDQFAQDYRAMLDEVVARAPSCGLHDPRPAFPDSGKERRLTEASERLWGDVRKDYIPREVVLQVKAPAVP